MMATLSASPLYVDFVQVAQTRGYDVRCRWAFVEEKWMIEETEAHILPPAGWNWITEIENCRSSMKGK